MDKTDKIFGGVIRGAFNAISGFTAYAAAKTAHQLYESVIPMADGLAQSSFFAAVAVGTGVVAHSIYKDLKEASRPKFKP